MIRRAFWALLSGLIFGAGLALGGMTQTAKVLGFLDIGGVAKGLTSTAEKGLWDPSLAFVMGGALLVSALAFTLAPRNNKPWAGVNFHLPTRQDIDGPLLLGGALFGVGWGLAGYCPGPAFASLLSGSTDVFLFVAAMVAGMWLAKRVTA